MIIQLQLHDSWKAVPVALSRLLVALTALEQPRQPGDDASDLTELLDGLLDDPEPAAPAPAPTRPAPAPQPAAALPAAGRAPDRPKARPFDGVPSSGRELYRWACDRKALPTVNRLAKARGFGHRVVDFTPEEVAILYGELTAEPAPNGRSR
jgi:hypothetical protein